MMPDPGPLPGDPRTEAMRGKPSPMRELHDDLVAALQESVRMARINQDPEKRARILCSCAQGFAAIDQAMTAKMVARLNSERDRGPP
jgi:hypothetical protein